MKEKTGTKNDRRHLSKMEKIWLMILLGIIVAIIIFMAIKYIWIEPAVNQKFESISLSQYSELLTSEEKVIIYVDDTEGVTYESFYEAIKSVMKTRSATIKFLDLKVVNENDQIIEFMDLLETTSERYTTPMLLVVENGNVVDAIQGIYFEKDLIDFLSRNSIS